MSVFLRKGSERKIEIFTVGHSNHSLKKFLGLLKRWDIDLVVDVRSQPYSRYVPHFNREPLGKSLLGAGVGYLFLGEHLGGRPREREYYEPNGQVRYDLVRRSPRFREGIERVKSLARNHRLALLCGEEDPAHCHRNLLVGVALVAEGFRVLHIRATGNIEEVGSREKVHEKPQAEQLTLF